MVRTVNAFLTTVCLLFAVEANAISGNDWKQLTETQQQAYVVGVVDAWGNLEEIASLIKDQPSSGVVLCA